MSNKGFWDEAHQLLHPFGVRAQSLETLGRVLPDDDIDDWVDQLEDWRPPLHSRVGVVDVADVILPGFVVSYPPPPAWLRGPGWCSSRAGGCQGPEAGSPPTVEIRRIPRSRGRKKGPIQAARV